MKKTLLTIGATLALVLGVGIFAAQPTLAADCTSAKDCVQSGLNAAGETGGNTSLSDVLKTVVNVMMFVLGAIAVIMIVIGGINYATSQGDSGRTKTAKDTILYAVIGLVVALFAYAIVNFVIEQFVQ